MTGEEERVVNVERRQESFESFMRAYIDGNEKRLDRIEGDLRDIKNKMDSLLQNIVIAGGVGVLTIIVTILATK